MTEALQRWRAIADESAPFEAALPDASGLARAMLISGDLDGAIGILEALDLSWDYDGRAVLLEAYAASGNDDGLRAWAIQGDSYAESLVVSRWVELCRDDDLQVLAEEIADEGQGRSNEFQIKVFDEMVAVGRADDAIAFLWTAALSQGESDDGNPFPRPAWTFDRTPEQHLIELLLRHERYQDLQRLADAGSVAAAWASRSHRSPWKWEEAHAAGAVRIMADMAAMAETAQFVAQWAAVAVAGGVVGNVAYDGLKSGVTKARRGLRSLLPRAPRSEAVQSRPATEAEAVQVAYAAIGQRCAELDVAAPDYDKLTRDAVCNPDGRWVLILRDARGTRYVVRVPPLGSAGRDVSVMIHIKGQL